jgi:hypothetical protein
MRNLARLLMFKVDTEGERFTLTRRNDVPTPVMEDGLTLDQAEELLNTWKLRGFHGG